jgi:hypothetical protein
MAYEQEATQFGGQCIKSVKRNMRERKLRTDIQVRRKIFNFTVRFWSSKHFNRFLLSSTHKKSDVGFPKKKQALD